MISEEDRGEENYKKEKEEEKKFEELRKRLVEGLEANILEEKVRRSHAPCSQA